MKCINCFKDFSNILIIKLVDRRGTKCFCPNCIAMLESSKSLILENDYDFDCQVSKKEGAVIFVSGNETYVLDKDIMHRLLRHNLKQNEYKKLVKIHGSHKYMLHDDFYTYDGQAIQPLE